MTTTNNFDQSSNGLNIELSCFRDTHLSQHYFDENFKVLQYSSYYENSILVFGTCFDEGLKYFDLASLENYNIKATTKKAIINSNMIDIDDLKDNAKHYYDKHYTALTKDELIECITEYCLYNDDVQEFLESTFISTFAVIDSIGYSQGDYSKVYIPNSVIEFYEGQTVETISDYLSDHIDNLIWNAPVYCKLFVNGDEIYLDELMYSEYDYDKDTLISKLKESDLLSDLSEANRVYVLEWLDDNLPEYPDYL